MRFAGEQERGLVSAREEKPCLAGVANGDGRIERGNKGGPEGLPALRDRHVFPEEDGRGGGTQARARKEAEGAPRRDSGKIVSDEMVIRDAAGLTTIGEVDAAGVKSVINMPPPVLVGEWDCPKGSSAHAQRPEAMKAETGNSSGGQFRSPKMIQSPPMAPASSTIEQRKSRRAAESEAWP